MEIVGRSLVIPLVDTELRHSDSIELGQGVHLFRLTPQYRDRLQKEEVLVGGYQSSLSRMSVGLSLEPSILYPSKHLSLPDSLLAGIFLSFALRLVTELPIDIPFWFDMSSDGQILGIGQTQLRTFRSSWQRYYSYLLDEGQAFERINIFRPYTLKLLEYFIEFPETNRIIKAIEFASIGFQTRHVPTRLVNQVMFMEILFSCDVQELSFQLASRISWYLRYAKTSAEREHL